MNQRVPLFLLLLSFFVFSCGTENEPTYTLTTSVSPIGSGVISPDMGEFNDGDVITLEALPNSGWEFERWEGDWVGIANPVNISINSDYNIAAIFKRSPFYLAENGITIKCPDTIPGDIGFVDGIRYESVDRELLVQRRNNESDLTKVCVSNVNDMYRMFYASQFNQPIGNWDVSNVTNMNGMFYNSPFNQPIGNWDVSNVTDMGGIFDASQFNQPIGNWDVSIVTNMSEMFLDSPFNQPIWNWDVSNVTNMNWMFAASSFNQPIEDWDVSNVTNMNGMFYNSPFNHPIGNWDVGKVTHMYTMFRESQFNQPIGDWDVSNVTEMSYMFYLSPFNQPINEWCVSQFPAEPQGFSSNSPLTEENKPIWGTCPD